MSSRAGFAGPLHPRMRPSFAHRCRSGLRSAAVGAGLLASLLVAVVAFAVEFWAALFMAIVLILHSFGQPISEGPLGPFGWSIALGLTLGGFYWTGKLILALGVRMKLEPNSARLTSSPGKILELWDRDIDGVYY